MFHILFKPLQYLFIGVRLIELIVVCIFSRWRKKEFDICLGPEPLINNVYFKKALELYGYKAFTLVTTISFITAEFDVIVDQGNHFSRSIKAFKIMVKKAKCFYFYFNGGPLGYTIFNKIEPKLLKLAKIKTVLFPYGGDVQDLAFCNEPVLKNIFAKDYPFFQKLKRIEIREQLDRWTKSADHVISGSDWVNYMYHWDTLLIAHFCIDLQKYQPKYCENNLQKNQRTIKILHAPNHRNIKGTKHFQKAVDELKKEGYNVLMI